MPNYSSMGCLYKGLPVSRLIGPKSSLQSGTKHHRVLYNNTIYWCECQLWPIHQYSIICSRGFGVLLCLVTE